MSGRRTELTDAVGNTIVEDGYVAYCYKVGSSVTIERRRVREVFDSEGYMHLEPAGDRLWLRPGEKVRYGRVLPTSVVVCP